jgi:hypothetical protein
MSSQSRFSSVLFLFATLLVAAPLLHAKPPQAVSAVPRTGVFPFLDDLTHYNVWQYLPMDQGSRQIELIVVGSEKDADLAHTVLQPDYFAPWGSPGPWDKLEKTEAEKSVWASRWYYLPSLAREYRVTHDRAYLDTMLRLIRQWRDDNPPPTDFTVYAATRAYNWRDMQVAWRVENLCWAYFLAEPGLTAAEKRELFGVLNTHAGILLQSFGAMALNENNHQSHGAAAMLYAALLFPDVDHAAELREKGMAILEHHLDKAFFDDGNSVELAPGYYPFIASIFRDVYRLCLANGVTPPARTLERLHQFRRFLAYAQQPDGTAPPINDSTESDMRTQYEILTSVLGEKSPLKPVSFDFAQSGQAVMRDPFSPISSYVFLDAGPRIAAHWHGGKLGFHLWFWDRPLVVDSGVSDYDDPLKRGWYVQPDAHNTLLVDGKGDVDPEQARHERLTDSGSSIHIFESNDIFDWAVMHTQLGSAAAPVQWTRHFILLKGSAAVVVDMVESSSEHQYTWLFHLAPSKPTVDNVTDAVFTALPEKNLLLAPAAPESIGITLANGHINRGGKNYDAPVARYHRAGTTLTQGFLLAPVKGIAPGTNTITQTSEDSRTTVVVVDTPASSWRLRLHRLTAKEGAMLSPPQPEDSFTIQLERLR